MKLTKQTIILIAVGLILVVLAAMVAVKMFGREELPPNQFEELEFVSTLPPLKPGDVFAMTKFTASIPEGYNLFIEDDLGRRYANGEASIEIHGANYNENFIELSLYAEDASTYYAVGRKIHLEDLEFEAPVNTSVAGFDAIRYDYLTTANDFARDSSGNVVKDESGRDVVEPAAFFKGRMYYFFSDEDIFYIIFETGSDDWDKNLPEFEEFIASIEILEAGTDIEVEVNEIESDENLLDEIDEAA
ncbi:MAG: hypothetical protein FWG90_11040 [Oscillospiraceae bacterium]|nr:hypothetical protein [Oscillospiraceae bacterium]